MNMNIIYSSWSPFNSTIILEKTNFKRSIYHSKKLGYKVHLFCCNKSYNILKDEPWDSLHFDLEKLNKEYKFTWSLGKIMTYFLASQMFDNFIHLDLDMTIFKPLEINNNSDFTVFYKDSSIYYKEYNKKEFLDYIPNEISITPEIFYNMAIFGGNSKSIYDYCQKSLDFILNERNKKFFCNVDYFNTFDQALFAEQFYFSSYVNYNKLNVNTILLNTPGSPEFSMEVDNKKDIILHSKK